MPSRRRSSTVTICSGTALSETCRRMLEPVTITVSSLLVSCIVVEAACCAGAAAAVSSRAGNPARNALRPMERVVVI